MLHVLGDAEAEIEAATDFLREQSSRLANRFREEVIAALAAIASRPLSFPVLETLPSESDYRRVLLATFPYAVIFKIVGDTIVVVAVSHGSRRPNYWLQR